MKYVSVTKSQYLNVQKERAGLAGRQVMGTSGADPGFQVRGGGAFKKIAPSRGRKIGKNMIFFA
jgi:hypothetical protein